MTSPNPVPLLSSSMVAPCLSGLDRLATTNLARSGATAQNLRKILYVIHELLEARDERRLIRLQRQVAGYKLLISTSLDMSLSPRPGQSCCSTYPASATSAVQPSSHRTCHSTNGPA